MTTDNHAMLPVKFLFRLLLCKNFSSSALRASPTFLYSTDLSREQFPVFLCCFRVRACREEKTPANQPYQSEMIKHYVFVRTSFVWRDETLGRISLLCSGHHRHATDRTGGSSLTYIEENLPLPLLRPFALVLFHVQQTGPAYLYRQARHREKGVKSEPGRIVKKYKIKQRETTGQTTIHLVPAPLARAVTTGWICAKKLSFSVPRISCVLPSRVGSQPSSSSRCWLAIVPLRLPAQDRTGQEPSGKFCPKQEVCSRRRKWWKVQLTGRKVCCTFLGPSAKPLLVGCCFDFFFL